MKIAILTNGPRAWAGSRLRGFWLEDANPVLFRVYEPGHVLDGIDDADVIVFQKRQSEADVERARRYKAEGRTVIYDVCDPVWWFEPRLFDLMVAAVDAVTVSNSGLGEAIAQHPAAKRVAHIPDRMLASFHPSVAEHGERERVRLVWFGAGQNRIALTAALPILTWISHFIPLELVVIDDLPWITIETSDPQRTKVTHIPWALETFHAQLVRADVAILPPYPGPWGELKSNNKQVTAWWCGLPTVTGFDAEELQFYLSSAEARADRGAINRFAAEANYNIERSVIEWQQLAQAIKDGTDWQPEGRGAQQVEEQEVQRASV